MSKEHWQTRWHKEDSYRLAKDGETKCANCAAHTAGRCSVHSNAKVSKDATCSKAQ